MLPADGEADDEGPLGAADGEDEGDSDAEALEPPAEGLAEGLRLALGESEAD